MMNKVNPYEILRMSQSGGDARLSIYAGSQKELDQGIAELKSLLEKEGTKSQAKRLIEPVEIWRTSHSSPESFPVGIFVSREMSAWIPIPQLVKPISVLSTSFHVKPLLRWVQRERPFAVLRFRQSSALLYFGSLAGLRLVDHYPFTRSRRLGDDIVPLENHVYGILDKSNVPLILAGPPKRLREFRERTRYKHVLPGDLTDKVSLASREELHCAALDQLEPYLQAEENRLIAEYKLAKSVGQTSCHLNEIVRMASQGEVKHLFINEEMNVWGKIDLFRGKFNYHRTQHDLEDDDVLDDLAELVIRFEGAVTVLPATRMPDSQAAAAIMRSSSRPRIPVSSKNWGKQMSLGA